MIKNSVIALVTAAALAGIAAPAMAGTSLTETSDNDFDAAYVLTQVQDKGINASVVEEWGDYIVASVTDANGKQTLVYLTPVTLDVVNL
ncbi:MAG: PepSY domain-containing protein [Devosia marina]|uniref:PepSY domain-containing protein n=1 Tax=Devosia marina TaxID=2683198 RepID=UPI0032EA9BE8